jgi:ATP-dependent DNA helicase RecG
MTDPTPFNEALLQSYDKQPLLSARMEQLDLRLVQEHIAGALDKGRFDGPREPMAYLQRYGGVGYINGDPHPTIAGLLCFGRDLQATLPHAVVDIGRYRGLEAVSFDVLDLQKSVGGTIFHQIEHVESYLWEHTSHGMTAGIDGARRTELSEYPRVVLRELVVNMLAHRDYRITNSTPRVFKFRDRIEWISPGGLPEGVTLDNILNAQHSRNPALTDMLQHQGLIEALGMGLDTVVRALKDAGMQAPRFQDNRSSFMVTVFGRPLELFSTADVAARLTERQRRILTFLRAQRKASPKDMLTLFDEKVTQRSLQRDLKELTEAGLIVATGKGRATTYRLEDGV